MKRLSERLFFVLGHTSAGAELRFKHSTILSLRLGVLERVHLFSETL